MALEQILARYGNRVLGVRIAYPAARLSWSVQTVLVGIRGNP